MLNTWKIRTRYEKLVYEKGINVALYHAERSKKYKKFVQQSREAILKQIASIANSPKRIESLLLLSKSASPELLKQLETFLSDHSFKIYVDLPAFLNWVGAQGGQAAMDKLQVEGVFGVVNPKIVKYFKDHSNLVINSVDNTTKRWIANRILEGKEKLLTPQEIAQTLIDEGKGISESRAQMIAVTETAQGLTYVEAQTAMDYGIKEKIWRTSLDDRVDDVCIGLEGAVAPIDGEFEGGFYGSDAHPGCRCFIEEVIPESGIADLTPEE